MKTKLTLIKAGSGILDDPGGLSLFLNHFKSLHGIKILVHGGGDESSRLATDLHISTKKIDGRRITDASMLDVMTMVCAGKINKKLVAELQGIGVQSIGLCGADGNLLQGKKRNSHPIDYGYVGDVVEEGVNIAFLQMLLNAGMVPVVAPLVHDGMGQLLNANADGVAKILAISLQNYFDVQLVFGFGLPGVLRDIAQADSKIDSLHLDEIAVMKNQGIFSGGMLPKIESAVEAVIQGVAQVRIADLKQLNQLEYNPNYGTRICH